MNKRQAKKKRKYQKFIEEYLKVSEKIQRAMLKKRPYTTGLEVDAIIIDEWFGYFTEESQERMVTEKEDEAEE